MNEIYRYNYNDGKMPEKLKQENQKGPAEKNLKGKRPHHPL